MAAKVSFSSVTLIIRIMPKVGKVIGFNGNAWIKKNSILSFFNVRNDEGPVVVLLICHSFFFGLIYVFLGTAASTLFLSEFGATNLPYVYIGIAAVTAVVGLIFSRLEGYLSFSNRLYLILTFVGVPLWLFPLLLNIGPKWVISIIFIWWYLTQVLINLEFWSLAGRIFTIRQGKRLFGLIGTGEFVAVVVGGFIIPIIVRYVPIRSLIYISAFGSVASLYIVNSITKKYGEQLRPVVDSQGSHNEDNNENQSLTIDKYCILIFAISGLSWISYYFVDNIFNDSAKACFANEQELASFFGVFFAVAGFLTFFSRLFITKLIISRFGLLFGMLTLPLLTGVMIILISTIGNFGQSTSVLFSIIVMMKLVDSVSGPSIDRATQLILYQPFPAVKRTRTQTIVEGVINPVAGGIAGLILLVLTKYLGFGSMQLATMLSVVLLAWVGVALILDREYRFALSNALSKRTLRGVDLSLNDASSLRVLRKGMSSSHPSEVIYSLNLLENINYQFLENSLISLLHHDHSKVRQHVLQRIDTLEVSSAIGAVKNLLISEKDSGVKGSALRTYAKLGKSDVVIQLSAFLEQPDQKVRLGAIVGLLKNGGVKGIYHACSKLLHDVDSKEASERKFAAKVIGEAGLEEFERTLEKLLIDADLTVQREAIVAAGKLGSLTLWPAVISTLSQPEIRSSAVSALVKGGIQTLGHLESAFNQKNQTQNMKSRIIRIYAQIKGDEVIKLLLQKMNSEPGRVYNFVLRALQACNYQAMSAEEPVIKERINDQCMEIVWALASLRDIGTDKEVELLRTALTKDIEECKDRIFLLLSFLYDPEKILQPYKNLKEDSKVMRAYAVEALENVLPSDLKPKTIPLVDGLSNAELLKSLIKIKPQDKLSQVERLHNILEKSPAKGKPWLATCAVFSLGQMHSSQSLPLIKSTLACSDSLTKETAIWALFKIDSEKLDEIIGDNPDHQTKKVMTQLADEKFDKNVLLTVRRIVILRRVKVFSEIPDDVLVHIANVADSIEAMAEEQLISKGEIAACLYIIVKGSVLVYADDRSVIHLETGEIVGEIALLDSAPRSANVVAAEDSILLKVDQATFYEIMADWPIVAQGIIRVLCRRFRRTLDLKGNQPPKSQTSLMNQSGISRLVNQNNLVGLEKILLLKTVSFFKDTPYEILAEMIPLLQDIRYKAEEVILRKGELGNCIYFIVSGKVCVYDDKRVISYLVERHSFGELALLDTQPRSVSVKAHDDTYLLVLHQREFYTLMADRIEVAHGIIRVLSHRIRSLADVK